MLPSKAVSENTARDSLANAFASFTEVAGSLEKSYGELQREVARLRRKLEGARRDLQRERQAARHWQALAQVSRVLAHEIRNPLASMELFTGLLASSRDLRGEDFELVARLQAGIRLLTATINNILQFHTAPSEQRTAIKVSDLLHETVDFLRPAASQAGVEIVFHDRLRSACVSGDPSRLQQVLLNVALNAIRVMASGGRLEFKGEDGEQVKIAIFDTGPGVPVELRESIFAAGFTTRPGSLGLGLAVARTIMRQHGGDIRLLPTARGAGFELTLPRIRMEGTV